MGPMDDDGLRRGMVGTAAVVSFRHMHALTLAHGESVSTDRQERPTEPWTWAQQIEGG
jgi:hypothetical protein